MEGADPAGGGLVSDPGHPGPGRGPVHLVVLDELASRLPSLQGLKGPGSSAASLPELLGRLPRTWAG